MAAMKNKTAQPQKPLTFIFVAAFWCGVWWAAAAITKQPLFLPTPPQVALALFRLCQSGLFWQSVATSLLRIAAGFCLGFVLACFLAMLSFMFKFVHTLLQPPLMLARAVPVASFVILALLWFSGKNLSVFTSFLMALPVVYSGIMAGLQHVSGQMLEMAEVFRLSPGKRFTAIYLPALGPSLLAAAQLAVGISWKSGIAAEVIGLPAFSIGQQLYQAKINLDTPDVFAWTFTAVLASWLFGKAVLLLCKKTICLLQRGEVPCRI